MRKTKAKRVINPIKPKEKQRLECVNKTKNISKFWEYKVMGDIFVVRFGRIGTTKSEAVFPTYQLESKLREKWRKGYKATSKRVK